MAAAQQGAFGCSITLQPQADQNFNYILPLNANDAGGATDVNELLKRYNRNKYFFKAFYGNYDVRQNYLSEKASHLSFIRQFNARPGIPQVEQERRDRLSIREILRKIFSIDIRADVNYVVNADALINGTQLNTKLCDSGLNNIPVYQNYRGNLIVPCIIMNKIGNYELKEIPNKNQNFSIHSYLNFLRKVRFLNYFTIQNDLHWGNISVHKKSHNFNILDFGLCYDPGAPPQNKSVGNWSYGLANLCDNFNNHYAYDDIADLFIASYNGMLGWNRRTDIFVGLPVVIHPWYWNDPPVAVDNLDIYRVQVIDAKTELNRVRVQNADFYNRIINQKHDLYFNSMFFMKLARAGYIVPKKTIQILSMLLMHPNSLLRPFPGTILKIFEKITRPEFYRTKIVYRNPDGTDKNLLEIPSFDNENHRFEINTTNINLAQINFNYDDLAKNARELNYFISIILLHKIWPLYDPVMNQSWRDLFDAATLPNKLFFTAFTTSQFMNIQSVRNMNNDQWKKIQKNVLFKITEELRQQEPQSLKLDYLNVTRPAQIPVNDVNEPRIIYEPGDNTFYDYCTGDI